MQNERLGNYQVVSCIGEGGMGKVYRVEHALLGRAAAIKVLLPELSQNQDMVDRFFNEARATAQLRHPGIVDVFDFGYCEDGAAYIVMELLHGESLTSRIGRAGRLPWRVACRFARQIASSLAAAHRAQIVHRDLKPDNVFVVAEPDQPEERTKVLDFGIAKLADAGARGSVKTRADLIMGTPAYMSPQQCRGAGQVDHRADIYALGCILFEMVCGRPPFVGEGFGDLINAHMMQLPPAPRGLVPELPEALEQLIFRMLAKAEAERPQSMEAVMAELDAIAGASGTDPGSAVWSPPPGMSDGSKIDRWSSVSTVGGSAGQVVAAAPAPSPRRRLPYLFAAAAVASMIGTAGVAVVYRGGPASAPAEEVIAEQSQPPAEAAVEHAQPPARPPEPPPAPVEQPAEIHAVEPSLVGPAAETPPASSGSAGTSPAIVPSPASGTGEAMTKVASERAPQSVIHELGCDIECEVVLGGKVVGRAGRGMPYRAELPAMTGQWRMYVLRSTDNPRRVASFRARADRSVKTTIHVPCPEPERTRGASRPRVYDPYDACNGGEP